MSATIIVKVGSRFYKTKVNPAHEHGYPWSSRDYENYARLCKTYVRQAERGKLASMIRIDRKIRKMEEKLKQKNPLIKSKYRASVGKNISYLLRHPKELTAKTPEMRRKQAIAIALSVWQREMKKKRRS